MAELNVDELQNIANKMRLDVIEMTTEAGSGHPGGSLSAADAVATLYFRVMNVDPADPYKDDRDRFVLSKGHAAPILHACDGKRTGDGHKGRRPHPQERQQGTNQRTGQHGHAV